MTYICWILKVAIQTKWYKSREIWNEIAHFLGPFFVVVRSGIYYK